MLKRRSVAVQMIPERNPLKTIRVKKPAKNSKIENYEMFNPISFVRSFHVLRVRPSGKTEEHELPSQTSTHRNRQRTTANANLKRQRRNDQPCKTGISCLCQGSSSSEDRTDTSNAPHSVFPDTCTKLDEFQLSTLPKSFPATSTSSQNIGVVPVLGWKEVFMFQLAVR